MLILITGGSSCGKSAFAEKVAVKMRERFGKQAAPGMIYIATMEPFSEDAKEKIKHHHELRAGKGFVTLEHYSDIEKAVPKLESFCDPEEGKKADPVDAKKNAPMPGYPAGEEKTASKSEDPVGAEQAASKQEGFCGRKKPVVLLECLSNLLANEMFAPGVTEEMRRQEAFENRMCRKICAGIRKLEDASACLIVVSCNVGEDGASYAWETVKYIHILQKIQVELAKTAAQAYEVVCGIPVVLK